MPKTLKDISNELKTSIKEDIPIELSSSKAKQSADELQRKLYEAEKRTGAPVGTFKQWKALD